MKQGFELLIDLRSQMHASAYWRAMYDTALVKKFISLFKEDWVVIDVGANIGYYTIPFALHIPEKGYVYAFEPQSENYKHLNLALKKNKCTHYQTFDLGLGATQETIGISTREDGITGNAVILKESLKVKLDYEETEKIEVIPFDQFVDQNDLKRCDFIKLDIEGYEIDFLKGARQSIKKFRPIIYGEFSNYYINLFNQDMKEVWQLCHELSYNIYAPINKRDLTKFTRINEHYGLPEDILLIPNELNGDKIDQWIN